MFLTTRAVHLVLNSMDADAYLKNEFQRRRTRQLFQQGAHSARTAFRRQIKFQIKPPQHLHTLVVRIMEILSVKTTISTSVGAQSVPSYLRPVGPSDMLPRFILVKIISLGLLTNFGRSIYTWPVPQLVNLSAWIWQWVRCEPSCTWLRSLSFGTNVTCTFGGWCMKDMLIYPRPRNCTSWRGGRGINKTQTMKQVKRLKDQIGFDTLIF